MTQPTLFDHLVDTFGCRPDPQAKRDEAINRVETNNADAVAHFERVAMKVIAKGRPFTTDDVIAADPDLERYPEKRAFGPVMMRLAREGKIRNVGYARSRRGQSHCRPKAMWEPVEVKP